MSDDRLARPSWRGRTNVDALTISCIERAEKMEGGHEFIVTQGSYQSSVSASAGTHDRGGVVDLHWCGHDSCIYNLRAAGMAGTWHRTPAQGPWPDHIHAVVYGHPDLAPAAARQITSVLAGRNGLANNGLDDGPRLHPFPKAVWPPQEDDDMFSDDDRATLEAISKTVATLDKARENTWKRDKALAKTIRSLAGAERKRDKALADQLEDVAARLEQDAE